MEKIKKRSLAPFTKLVKTMTCKGHQLFNGATGELHNCLPYPQGYKWEKN